MAKLPNKAQISIAVTDNDPEGFPDLSHAYTVFAPSHKKGDPTKAGRFNLGEKFFLAFCREATIATTKGTIEFSASGREDHPRRKTDKGTVIMAKMDCTTEQLDQLISYLKKLIVKPGLTLMVNGEEVRHRKPFKSFTAKLATEIADEVGNLKRTVRMTEVELYEPQEGETPMLYELGIPIIETGDKWHANVLQKVPLNMERDNVTPSYLRDLRTFVYNNTFNLLSEADTEEVWVNEATSDDKVIPEAIEDFRVKKFGEKSVAEDPFNPEANKDAASNNYTVIPKHALTKGQRKNLREHNFLISSSSAFPNAGRDAYSDDPNAPAVEIVPESEWTEGMSRICDYTHGLAVRLLGKQVRIIFVKAPSQVRSNMGFAACYGRGPALSKSEFHFNLSTLGRKWFDHGANQRVNELILHEFGHEFCSDHLSADYHKGLCKLGARFAQAVLEEPDWFRSYMPAE